MAPTVSTFVTTFTIFAAVTVLALNAHTHAQSTPYYPYPDDGYAFSGRLHVDGFGVATSLAPASLLVPTAVAIFDVVLNLRDARTRSWLGWVEVSVAAFTGVASIVLGAIYADNDGRDTTTPVAFLCTGLVMGVVNAVRAGMNLQHSREPPVTTDLTSLAEPVFRW